MDEILQKIQGRGVLKQGSLTFGFEEDEKGDFKKMADFLIEYKITYGKSNILTFLFAPQILSQFEKDSRG
jgi:hypothetical protein